MVLLTTLHNKINDCFVVFLWEVKTHLVEFFAVSFMAMMMLFVRNQSPSVYVGFIINLGG